MAFLPLHSPRVFSAATQRFVVGTLASNRSPVIKNILFPPKNVKRLFFKTFLQKASLSNETIGPEKKQSNVFFGLAAPVAQSVEHGWSANRDVLCSTGQFRITKIHTYNQRQNY